MAWRWILKSCRFSKPLIPGLAGDPQRLYVSIEHMIIRTEKENDRDAVYAINESAFETPSEYNKADEPDGKNLGPFPLYS
jgi:hypothetical protein